FNEAVVAPAIYDSRSRVVSAVGPEIDVTVADRVADRRALTPSEAAELVVPSRDELAEWLRGQEKRLRALLLGHLKQARRRWQELADRPAFRLPLERVRERERWLDELAGRMGRAVRQRAGAGRAEGGGDAGRGGEPG